MRTLIALVLLTVPALASAQELVPPRTRQGYYLAGGLQMQGSYIRENGNGLGVWNGSGFALRLGELLEPSLGVGLELDFGSTVKGRERASLVGITLEGQWEVVTNLSLRAGVGLGVLAITDPNDISDTLRGSVGSQYDLTLAYDWFPFADDGQSGGAAVTPLFIARFLPSKHVDSLFLGVGVELTWWTGLPQNRLELPLDQAFER